MTVSPNAPSAPSSPVAAALQWIGGRWRGALVLVAVVFALFAPAANNRLTLDSGHFLTEDLRVREFRVGELLTKGYWNLDPDDPAQRTGPGDLWRPLTLVWLSAWWNLSSDDARGELRPTMLNLADIGLHAWSVVLRFWLFLLLLGTRRHAGAIAFFAALLCAVHPIATEAVATQVGAAEGLAMVGCTAALLAWHRWQAEGSSRHAWHFAGWILFGLLAKENAIAIAAIAPLGTLLLLRRSFGDAARVVAMALLPIAVWMLLRLWVSGALAAVKDPVLAGYGLVAGLQTALAGIGWYDLMALLAPYRLLAFVSHQVLSPPEGFGDLRVIAGIAAVVAVVGGMVASWRRSPLVAFGLAFFTLAFFPVSNLVVRIGALAATRFLYLPMTGLALAAAVGVARAANSERVVVRRIAAALAVALPIWFSVWTARELPTWRSEVDLQRTQVARAPDAFGWSNFGSALLEEIGKVQASGDKAGAAALQGEAERAFAAAFATERPRIPGTGAVPEDVLEVQYRAGTSLAVGLVQWRNDFDAAIKVAESMRELAQLGARQSEIASGQAYWAPIESDVECMLGELWVQKAQRVAQGSKERNDALAAATASLDRARKLMPDSLRPSETQIKVTALRGDKEALEREFAAMYAEAKPRIARHSAATRVALAYAQFLESSGRIDASLKVALDTVITGKDRIGDAGGFFSYGARGMRSQDPQVRALARQALEIFLQRADGRMAQNIVAARRMLGRG